MKEECSQGVDISNYDLVYSSGGERLAWLKKLSPPEVDSDVRARKQRAYRTLPRALDSQGVRCEGVPPNLETLGAMRYGCCSSTCWMRTWGVSLCSFLEVILGYCLQGESLSVADIKFLCFKAFIFIKVTPMNRSSGEL